MGSQCSRAAIDSRCAPHCSGCPFALCTAALARISQDLAAAALLRRESIDGNRCHCHQRRQWEHQLGRSASASASAACPTSGSSAGGGVPAIEVAAECCSGEGHAKSCSLGGCRRCTWRCRVSPNCSTSEPILRLRLLPVDEVDEPEWAEPSGSFWSCGLNALQLTPDLTVDAHSPGTGADASSLARLPAPPRRRCRQLAPQLAPIKVMTARRECPICYEPLLRLTSE